MDTKGIFLLTTVLAWSVFCFFAAIRNKTYVKWWLRKTFSDPKSFLTASLVVGSVIGTILGAIYFAFKGVTNTVMFAAGSLQGTATGTTSIARSFQDNPLWSILEFIFLTALYVIVFTLVWAVAKRSNIKREFQELKRNNNRQEAYLALMTLITSIISVVQFLGGSLLGDLMGIPEDLIRHSSDGPSWLFFHSAIVYFFFTIGYSPFAFWDEFLCAAKKTFAILEAGAKDVEGKWVAARTKKAADVPVTAPPTPQPQAQTPPAPPSPAPQSAPSPGSVNVSVNTAPAAQPGTSKFGLKEALVTFGVLEVLEVFGKIFVRELFDRCMPKSWQA